MPQSFITWGNNSQGQLTLSSTQNW